jgi:hypothetical protein
MTVECVASLEAYLLAVIKDGDTVRISVLDGEPVTVVA